MHWKKKKIIQERKQAEYKLRESEEKYRLIFESTGTAAILVDEHTTILQANNECGSVTGYSPNELVGTSWTNYVYKEDLPVMLENAKVRIKDPSLVPSKYEIRLINAKGEIRNAILSIGFIPESKRSIVSMIDITEHKQAEEKLKAANQQLQASNQQLQATEQKLRAANQELITSEKALKESELKFQKIIYESYAGISVVNEEGKIIIWNNALEKITGILKAQTIDSYIWDIEAKLIDNETTATKRKGEVKTALLDILKTGKASWLNMTMEREYIHPDGTVKIVSGSMYTIKTQKGYLVVSVSNDITERKQAEEKLKESEETYRNLFHNAQVGLYRTRIEDGKILESNEQIAIMFGYKNRSEFINEYKTSDNYVDPGTREKMLEIITEKGEINNYEARFYRKDHSIFWANYSAKVYPEKGWIEGVIEDITERKQAEAELLKLSTAVKQSPSVIAITDTKGKLEYVNPKFTEITGYGQMEVIGQNPRILKSGKHPAEMYKVLWETISSGKTWRGEMHNKKKSGGLFWEMVSISPIFDEQGELINYIKVAEDITERKQAEEELNKYREHLEELVKERTAELEEKNKELEHYNSLFEGREFRIKELRDQVKELKAKLGE